MIEDIKLVKAFSNNPDFGNPAGVVIDASSLSDEQMQAIAKKLNFSESAFVLPSKVADYRVRFFTVNQEVDYCGHATLATYSELFGLPENSGKTSLTQETLAGIFTIEKTADGKIMMTQKDPVFGGVIEDRSAICGLLGTSTDSLDSSLPIQIIQNNVYELVIPCKSAEILESVKPNLSALVEFVKDKPYHGVYCFALSTDGEHDLLARSFAPSVGVDEDPATGVAAGPLACYVDKYLYDGQKKQIKINQGMWMGMSSDIYVNLTDGVKVGGYAVRFGNPK
jgi:PhzF family phenazine biosynthesis protein